MSAQSLVAILRIYLECNSLLFLALLLTRGLELLSVGSRMLSSLRALRIAQGVLLAAVFSPIALNQIPTDLLLRPAVQVWTGRDRLSAQSYAFFAPRREVGEKQAGKTELSGWNLGQREINLIILLLVISSVVSVTRYARALLQLKACLRESTKIRAIGRVLVLAAENIQVPYSVRCWRYAFVVLPTWLVTCPQSLHLSVRHEIQHHRNGDTLWAHVLECLKAMFALNPAIYALARAHNGIQEFACDEVLIGHRNISPHAYGRCLLQVAQSAISARTVPAGTTGMAAGACGQTLRRRIEMMCTKHRTTAAAWSVVIALGAAVAMASAAFAARSVVQDRVLTMAQARALAQTASRVSAGGGPVIPITMNELVLSKLNRFVGTPEGRRYVREGLVRLPQYRELIERKIGQFGFPEELLAIPLFESGFRNDVVSPPPSRAAGIWQFVAQTARRYHLVVSDRVDERLNPEKETDAAMRYYGDLFQQFQDWRLVLKAYNEGERRVQGLIDKVGTRDPWVLERHSTTESYLSGAIAMMIILKNPELVD